MKKSQLRKLIRTTLKENAIDENLQRLELNELAKTVYVCVKGDGDDVYADECDGGCPCPSGCTCMKIRYPRPEELDKSDLDDPFRPDKLDRIDKNKVIAENEGCKERTLNEDIQLAHKYGYSWVKSEEDLLLLEERSAAGRCVRQTYGEGGGGSQVVNCDANQRCFKPRDCKKTESPGMMCGCATVQRPVEPNKGDFLPDPIKPDKLDRIDFNKNIPS